MKRSAFLLATLLLAAGTVPAAWAETPPAQRHGDGFKKLDSNGDGKLSRDEAKARPNLERNFNAIDTDKDGFLSRQEVEAARQKAAAKKAAAQGDSPVAPPK